jgi:hypothetical protein
LLRGAVRFASWQGDGFLCFQVLIQANVSLLLAGRSGEDWQDSSISNRWGIDFAQGQPARHRID